jgi:hypothetical protein
VQLQSELSRLRQDLQDKTTEEQLRQQMNEKTWKTLALAKSKITHLSGNFVYPIHTHTTCVPGTHTDKKRVLPILEVESWIVASH